MNLSEQVTVRFRRSMRRLGLLCTSHDIEGVPERLVHTLQRALLYHSKELAEALWKKGYRLFALSPKKFLMQAFRVARTELNVTPHLSPQQFFQPGFVQQKLEFVSDVVDQACEYKGRSPRPPSALKGSFVGNIEIHATARSALRCPKPTQPKVYKGRSKTAIAKDSQSFLVDAVTLGRGGEAAAAVEYGNRVLESEQLGYLHHADVNEEEYIIPSALVGPVSVVASAPSIPCQSSAGPRPPLQQQKASHQTTPRFSEDATPTPFVLPKPSPAPRRPQPRVRFSSAGSGSRPASTTSRSVTTQAAVQRARDVAERNGEERTEWGASTAAFGDTLLAKNSHCPDKRGTHCEDTVSSDAARPSHTNSGYRDDDYSHTLFPLPRWMRKNEIDERRSTEAVSDARRMMRPSAAQIVSEAKQVGRSLADNSSHREASVKPKGKSEDVMGTAWVRKIMSNFEKTERFLSSVVQL